MHWIHWALLSAFFAGLTAILAKLGVQQVEANTATAIRTSVIFLLTWGVVAATQGLPAAARVPSGAWMPLVASGLATGLSWLCYFRALELGPASRVAPVDKLSVVFVLLLAALFLGEPLTLRTTAGAALIVAGAIVLARG